MTTKEEKPTTSTSANEAKESVTLHLMSQDGDEVHIRVRVTTPLVEVMNCFAERKCIKDINQLRFLYDGMKLSKDSTPQLMGMKDGDSIDVMAQQQGG